MAEKPEVQAILDEAKKLTQERKLGDAIAAYQRAIKLDDLSVGGHEGLAMLSFAAKDFPTAIKHFGRVVVLDPRRVQAQVNLGAVYNRIKDYKNAITALQKAISKDRKCAEAYYNMGIAHKGTGQLAMAASSYKEALRLNPEMADAHHNLGKIFVEQKNFKQAIIHFEKAAAINPKMERAQVALNNAREMMDQAKNSSNPFGRLVDAKSLDANKSLEQANVRLSEEERYDDRVAVRNLTGEVEAAGASLLDLIREGLEPALISLGKSISQSDASYAVSEAADRLNAAKGSFEKNLRALVESVTKLKDHEEELTYRS